MPLPYATRACRSSPLAAVVFNELLGGFSIREPDAFVEAGIARLEPLETTGRVRASLAAHAPYSVAPSVFQALRRGMTRASLAPCSVHLAESPEETELVHSGTGPWRTLLEELSVAHRADALPREISGGEAQRVAIARALAMDPPLLLMDEPTASLDPVRRRDLGETLGALTASGRTLLITSHDDDFVRDFATRVVVLSGGEVVEEGPPQRVISHPQHPATQRLLMTERARRRPAV